jgi:acyl carrier protein
MTENLNQTPAIESIAPRVFEIIAKQKRIPVEKVTIESTFADLGLDSLDSVNMLFDLESEFDISIPDEEARNIKTVREMVEGVHQLILTKSQSQAAGGESSPTTTP